MTGRKRSARDRRPCSAWGEAYRFFGNGPGGARGPSENCFSRIARKITEWGLQVDPQELKEAYFYSKGAFEHPVTKNSELAEVVFTAADFHPRTTVSPSGQKLPKRS